MNLKSKTKLSQQTTPKDNELARAELEGRISALRIISDVLIDMAGRLRAAAIKMVALRNQLSS